MKKFAKRSQSNQNAKPIADYISWPKLGEPIDHDIASLALARGRADIVARYLRQAAQQIETRWADDQFKLPRNPYPLPAAYIFKELAEMIDPDGIPADYRLKMARNRKGPNLDKQLERDSIGYDIARAMPEERYKVDLAVMRVAKEMGITRATAYTAWHQYKEDGGFIPSEESPFKSLPNKSK